MTLRHAVATLFTLPAVLTGCDLLGIGEDLPERVTLEVPTTHLPERIVMGMDEGFGVCRGRNEPYAIVDWMPQCKQRELAAGRAAVVEHFGGYKMECWDPVQRWDARVEWGPDGSYRRINGGETRPCADFEQALGAVEVSRERVAFAYDGGRLGCGSSGNCNYASRYFRHGFSNLRRDPDRGYVCIVPGEAVLTLDSDSTTVDCRAAGATAPQVEVVAIADRQINARIHRKGHSSAEDILPSR